MILILFWRASSIQRKHGGSSEGQFERRKSNERSEMLINFSEKQNDNYEYIFLRWMERPKWENEKWIDLIIVDKDVIIINKVNVRSDHSMRTHLTLKSRVENIRKKNYLT